MRTTGLLLLCLLFWIPEEAFACSCEPVQRITVDELAAAAADSHLVFVGTVVAIDSTTFSRARVFVIEVTATIGGLHLPTQRISTGLGDADCGVYLFEGIRYLLAPSLAGPTYVQTKLPSIDLCGAPRQIVVDPGIIDALLSSTLVSEIPWGVAKQLRAAGPPVPDR